MNKIDQVKQAIEMPNAETYDSILITYVDDIYIDLFLGLQVFENQVTSNDFFTVIDVIAN